MTEAAAQVRLTRPLRVAMVWNGTVHAEELFTEPTPVTLGMSRGATFPLPGGVTEERDVTLLKPEGSSFVLQTLPGMGGAVFRNGKRESLAELGQEIKLSSTDYGVVTLGATSLFFQHVRPVKGPPPRELTRDAALLTCLGLSLFLHIVAAVFVFVLAPNEAAPVDPLELDSQLLRKFLIIPPPEDLPNKIVRRSERTDRGLRDREEASAARARDEQGKLGKREATPSTTQIAGKPADNVAQQVRGLGLLGVLSGGRNRAVTTALDTPSLQGLLGGLGAVETRIGQGSGGLATRGGGTGGGGLGPGALFGAGDLGTAVGGGKGKGREPGGGGGGMRQAREAQLSLDTAAAKVSGFLSAEQINRVVQANRAAIKYCFEGGLQRNPHLSGSLSAAFRIDRKGAVSSTRVAKSTLGDPKVESCILRQIARFRFPEPDGGEVDVVYPFLFRGP